MFAARYLAEYGLGFLINIYDVSKSNDDLNPKLFKKYVFDAGSINKTYLHNLDIRRYNLLDLDALILSHWHYDHTGSFYEILERINKKIPIICHDYAKLERIFRRSNEISSRDLMDKTREEIQSLISSSKIVSQPPIDLERVKKLRGCIIFSKQPYELMNIAGLKIIVSGEIPRIFEEENFTGFFSLQDGIFKNDDMMDDKCLILEYDVYSVVLLGCCHSGIMNTLEYVKSLTQKPITHIIGGFHLANATNIRIKKTIDYLKKFQESDNLLYLFPIHCT